jgi:hypothetical protein
MDLPIQKGYGCVWGIGTTKIDLTPGGTDMGSGQLFPLEEDLTQTRQSDPNYDPATGGIIGEVWFRKESSLRVRVYPAGSTLAAANSMNLVVIEPGQEVEVLDPTEPANNGGIAGTWSVVEVGKARRHQEKVYMDLTLRRHGDNTQVYSNTRISQLTPN